MKSSIINQRSEICNSIMNEPLKTNYKIYPEEIDVDFDLSEDIEGNDIPLGLEHIDANKLYRESMEDCDDDYYLQLMKLGEGARIRSGSKESRNIRIKK